MASTKVQGEVKSPSEPGTGALSNDGAGETESDVVHEDPNHGDLNAPPLPKKRRLYQRPAFRIVALLVLVIGIIFIVRYWLHARSHESTDDAFIDGHIIQVSPRVSGYV